MSAPTISGWQARLLGLLGAQPTDHNLAFLNAWLAAEGGTATNNPFNTTLEYGTGWTNYNPGGVKNYPSPVVGIEATAKTLLASGHGYEAIVNDLRADAAPETTAGAVLASEWGTTTFPTLQGASAGSGGTGGASTGGGSALTGCATALAMCLFAWGAVGAGAVALVRWLV